jgi:hypothetical protein
VEPTQGNLSWPPTAGENFRDNMVDTRAISTIDFQDKVIVSQVGKTMNKGVGASYLSIITPRTCRV